MKNVLRGSLLAVLFLGMSGFVSNNNSLEKTDFDTGLKCEDFASHMYYVTLDKGGTYAEANAAFHKEYWACIEDDGPSDFIANP